jgi:hypothetical protein
MYDKRITWNGQKFCNLVILSDSPLENLGSNPPSLT